MSVETRSSHVIADSRPTASATGAEPGLAGTPTPGDAVASHSDAQGVSQRPTSRTPLGHCSARGCSWEGWECCHCSICHRTLANEAAFDQHILIGCCG